MPIFKSPSTSIRSVDVNIDPLSEPKGVPAIVIGTSRRGQAFIPITVASFKDFRSVFGSVDKERFGPLAMKYWLSDKTAGTYYKVLGVGDGNKRDRTGLNSGRVNNAGYVVGSRQVQSNGLIGNNQYAGENGPLGRTYILGCFMSESDGSTIFTDAGIQTSGQNQSAPIIRGVLMAASGVHLSLNTEAAGNNEASTVASNVHSTTADGGLSYGDVLLGGAGDRQNIILILNGFTPNGIFTNAITASLDPQAYSPEGSPDPKPIRDAFNTDPTKLEQSGHYLSLFYDIPTQFAVPTGANITSHVDTNTEGATLTDGINKKLYQTAFLLTSSMNRNSGSSTTDSNVGVPNFENFENRYTNAYSPMVFSQTLEGKSKDLFQIFSKDDGSSGALNYKITIDEFDFGVGLGYTEYPKFNVSVRRLTSPDEGFGTIDVDPDSVLEFFEGVTLDPSDPKFISRVIGDIHTYYDFDKRSRGGQKLVVDGNHIGISRLVRVAVTQDVAEGKIDPKAIPVGFRGLPHLITAGSTVGGSILTGTINADPGSAGTLSTTAEIPASVLQTVVQPPVPLRESLFVLGPDGDKVLDNKLTWGFQSENKISPTDPNTLATFHTASISYLRYMPDFNESFQNVWAGNNSGTPDIGGCVFDSDRYNNNIFTLERIEVITSSLKLPDKDKWVSSVYRRKGKASGILQDSEGVLRESRLLRGSDFSDLNSKIFYKFTFPLVGGFDGVNIFDYDKSNFTNNAVLREFEDPQQGGRNGPTVSAYMKAREFFEEKDHKASVLCLPGIRDMRLTREFLSLADQRSDIFYVSDIEERGTLNEKVTGSLEPAATSAEVLSRTSNVRNAFLNEPEDTTYGAAFYPDVRIVDSDLSLEEGSPGHKVPPSVAVMGIMSRLPDHIKLLGPSNGRFERVVSSELIFSDDDIDEFYQSGINLFSGPSVEEGGGGTGPFLRSQNTFQRSLSPLSRISVRRMLLFVRRRIRDLLRQELFEPLTRNIYPRVRGKITRELAGFQAQGMFKLSIVEVPSLPQEIKKDVERNVLRAKILIRPNDVSETFIIDLEEPL